MFTDQAGLSGGQNGPSGVQPTHGEFHWSGAEVDQDVCHATLRQFEYFESDASNQMNQRHVRSEMF